MNRKIRLGLCIAATAAAITFHGKASADDTLSKVTTLAPLLACEVTPQNNVKSVMVFHLSGYDEGGTSYYRAITSNIIELIIKPDGSVESQANPCIGELKFYTSSFN